jgi:hypothetical protein
MMKEGRCTACRHPKSWHDGTDTLYRKDPEKFADTSKGHPSARDMCQKRSCSCLGWNKVPGFFDDPEPGTRAEEPIA